MNYIEKWNGFQYLGVILSLLGILLVAFPSAVGIVSLKIITFGFIMFAFLGLTIASLIRSKLTILVSIIVLMLSFYAYANPDMILYVIGLGLIISGFNGIFLYLKRTGSKNQNALLSSIIFIALGVFAVINAQAALSTIVMIAGIMATVIGIILIVTGNSIKIFQKNVDQATRYYQNDQKKSRVIVNIKSDEVEEVDFKEIH